MLAVMISLKRSRDLAVDTEKASQSAINCIIRTFVVFRMLMFVNGISRLYHFETLLACGSELVAVSD